MRTPKTHRKKFERHRATSFSFRGKTDSVYLVCECGFQECVGSWYETAPKGWDTEQWSTLIKSIRLFLESWVDKTPTNTTNCPKCSHPTAQHSKEDGKVLCYGNCAEGMHMTEHQCCFCEEDFGAPNIQTFPGENLEGA